MSAPYVSDESTTSESSSSSTASTEVNSVSIASPSTPPSPPPRRMTISNTPSVSIARAAQIARRPGQPMDEQCTHTTMTRLFTNIYHCSKCRLLPANGWLWRCTQDRELMLENDEDKDVLEKFDAISDLFGKAKKPLKGSPTARKDPLSFFDEITDDQLRTYSQEQIDIILAQRKNLLDVAHRANTGEFRTPFSNSYLPHLGMTYFPRSEAKPWLPILGGECQTKCCQNCWPHGHQRSFLSINGIVNGDLPREAIHGFSFSLDGKRTVHDARVVANLGLRPNPIRVGPSHSPSFLKKSYRLAMLETISMVPKKPEGLGISTSFQAGPSRPPRAPSPPPKPKPRRPLRNRRRPTQYPLALDETSIRQTPLSPTNGSFPPEIPFPPSPTLTRRHSFDVLPNVPLPEQTEEEIQAITPVPVYDTSRFILLSSTRNKDRIRFAGDSGSSIAAVAGTAPDTPISLHSNSSSLTEEVDITDIPLMINAQPSPMTDMEQEEAMNGEGIGAFGAEPLQVIGGVAVLEESVENHVPDIIFQY